MSDVKQAPALATLVRAGDTQTEAVAINDFIFMAKDISNAYLVNTDDGDVMVNTGFMDNAARNKALFDPVRSGPMRAIILTQSHADHFGGVPVFAEAGTSIIAQAEFVQNWKDMMFLRPHFGPRTAKLWGSTMKRGATPIPPPEVFPNVIVDREHAFEQGGRRFEIISTPDGESTDALTVWMPNEKIVFTGNLFGPVFLSMPFLCTLRGDKPRLVRHYLRSLDRVRNLGAELLITGHGDPIAGAERIRADLDKMHAAVTWVRDYVFSGMNAGKKVEQLMAEVALPPELTIGEFHGKASWAVRTIWEEYSGWFHYDSTTSLYGVPRSSVYADLVELAGADRLVARAQEKLDAGQPLESLHLIDIALGAEPKNSCALKVKKAAVQRLLDHSGGNNLSETMWLRSEITTIDAALATDGDAAVD